MRIFSVAPEGVQETADLPATLSPQGFVWISLERPELERRQLEVQSCLLALCGIPLVELHLSDLLNDQLPSHYDYTSQYDLLVFRRLAAGTPGADNTQASGRRRALPVLRRIDTSPVGFAVFDRILLTIHPSDCAARDAYASKLLSAAADARSSGARLPASPADLMMRIVNQMVDGYLDLRRELTRQLDHWQAELLAPRSRFSNWASLLDARMT
ncbi:MAG: hypothetical protein RLZZ401_991, partial [Pseudomonadota bacterium]